ncbi:uncharacterized protein PpBr36_10904 [Pyricularia pennisetigena]|uniref:uncharacterized protein n=1 Tax=Pyricularia pennisetigena TaxID=1578925 RepID=UPI0011519C0A|nr:uncharacterized protein PpBr36_10904 [Pyricularia pennisetigena]TLS20803.1 hypothetical protein PpBr36_10904 [Pyricularia pennisetigena]
MAQKTWFFPPDFTFRPTGELALGTVIKHPSHPTLALASLRSSEQPKIDLPEIDILQERSHVHSQTSKRSANISFLAKFVDLASARRALAFHATKNGYSGVWTSKYKPISRDALKAITRLEPVKKHINSGIFGKKPVYIITGLRVAKSSFQVTDQTKSSATISLGASGPAPAWVLPLEIGGGISGACEQSRKDSYETGPDVVYAYRVHKIRAKKDGDEAELFSYRGAFDASESEDEEVECKELTANMLREDPEMDFDVVEHLGEGELFIAFKGDLA